MTFMNYVVVWAVGAALAFILIWLDKQWSMSKAGSSAGLDFFPALMMTVFWPFALIFMVFAGVCMGAEHLWGNQILFKKKAEKEKKVCQYRGLR